MTIRSLTPAVLDVSIRKDYVEVRDGAGAITSVLTLKKNDYGLWQMVWDHGTTAADYLASAQSSGQDLGRWGLVFRQPGTDVVVGSGPITTIIDSEGRRNGVAGDALSAWGVTDLTHLRERIVFPVPTVDIPASTSTPTLHSWGAFTRTKTGPAETLALAYINENIGAGALARRRLPCTLTVPASLGRGPVVTVAPQANKNVLEVVQQLMALAGLVIDVVQGGPGELVLVIRGPEVKSGIVWSAGPGGTAAGVSVKTQRRPKTDVVNSGSGDDATTVYVRRVAPAPVAGFSEVREEFIKGSGSRATEDREATDDLPARTAVQLNADLAAELVVDADEEIAEDGPEYGLDVEPLPDAAWRVGIDYQVGDITIGVLRNVDFEVPITSVLLRHEDGTLTEEPSVAFEDDTSLEPLVRRILTRIRRLGG